ncbi:MAG: SOS response-associated peptidase [Chloroflexota bacterium]
MCGRFTLSLNPDVLREVFELDSVPAELAPRYNIAPTQPVAAVLAADGGRKLELLKWGLIPSWAKDPKIGNPRSVINARGETLAEKPSFRTALKKRRCLILADGFYEWKKEGKTKTPMFIQLKDGRPFAFAGLWEAWKSPENEWIKSCTIITTEPNSLMEKIHDRMPVILPPKAYDLWLTPGELPAEKTLPLLKPFAASQMKAVAVSTLVNNPAFDSPECVRPI